MAAIAVFAVAAVAHVLRYALLLVNRTMLLPPWVAVPGALAGVLASLAACATVVAVTVVMTAWLVSQRAVAYGEFGRDDPRPTWTLWAGCLIPLVSLFWAPVFLIELAHVQRVEERQRRPIAAWWAVWALSTLLAAWAIWTRWATEPQAVADNTVTMIVTYLAGTAALLLLWKVFDGFVGRPVRQSRHRWVVVEGLPPREMGSQDEESAGAGEKEARAGDESAETVEPRDREPAA